MKAHVLSLACLSFSLVSMACQKGRAPEPAAATGTISGRVLVDDLPAQDWLLRLEKDGERIRHTDADADGRFEFRDIPTGTYGLVAGMYVNKQMFGKRVRLEVKKEQKTQTLIRLNRGESWLDVKLDKALARNEEGVIYLFAEKMTAKSGAELFQYRKKTVAPVLMKVCGKEKPCLVSRLTAGDYTACLCPLGMSYDRWLTQGPADEIFLKLKPTCEQLKISDAPENRVLAFRGD